MTTKKTLALLALALPLTAGAQSTAIERLFASMPDSLLPLLSENSRHEMLALASNGMEATVRNLLGDDTSLLTLSPTCLSIDTSKKGRTYLKLLAAADSTEAVVMLVRTAFAPSADSQAMFYDTRWQRLSSIELPRPSASDFWHEAPDSLATLASQGQALMQDLPFISIRPLPDEEGVEMEISQDVLGQEEEDAASLLVHPLRYVWDGAAFLPKEQ